jgi:hypothetical protein
MEYNHNNDHILTKEYEDMMKGFFNSSVFATAPRYKNGNFIQYSAYGEKQYGDVATTLKEEHLIDTKIIWEAGVKY